MKANISLTDSNELIERHCPCCGNETARTSVAVRAPIDPESLPAAERDEFWRGFRSKSCFFDYVRCRHCNLLYCPTYFSDAALERLYSSMPDNTAGASPDVLRHTQQGYIDFLAQQRPLRGTYLEIGPDIGLATAAARSAGALDRAVLVEPNLSVHAELKEAAGDVPATIVARLGELDPDVQADAAVLIHVLDHLVDPMSFLKDLRQHLSPGALVLAVVHNEASALRRILGVRWPPFTLQHPQLFSPRTLRSALKTAGFEVVAERPTTNVFPASHIVKTAGALVGVKGAWIDSLPGWRVRIRLGNIMALAQSA